VMQGAKEKKEYFTKVLANTFKDAKVKDYGLRLLTPTATEVAVSFEASNLMRKDKDYAYLSLKNPYLFNSDFNISLMRENRQTPLVFPTAFCGDLKALIKFPKQWKVTYLPEKVTLENELASLSIDCVSADGEISITKRLTLKNRTVSPQDYSKLRNLLLNGELEKNNTVIFQLQ
ncbi:MAG: DUF3858 domain-containing protein, partial [bacterium]